MVTLSTNEWDFERLVIFKLGRLIAILSTSNTVCLNGLDFVYHGFDWVKVQRERFKLWSGRGAFSISLYLYYLVLLFTCQVTLEYI